MLGIMKSISIHLKTHFKDLRDVIGVNVCALKIIKKEINEQKAEGAVKREEFDLNFSKPESGFEF